MAPRRWLSALCALLVRCFSCCTTGLVDPICDLSAQLRLTDASDKWQTTSRRRLCTTVAGCTTHLDSLASATCRLDDRVVSKLTSQYGVSFLLASTTIEPSVLSPGAAIACSDRCSKTSWRTPYVIRSAMCEISLPCDGLMSRWAYSDGTRPPKIVGEFRKDGTKSSSCASTTYDNPLSTASGATEAAYHRSVVSIVTAPVLACSATNAIAV